MIRLDKYLADCGYGSRKEVKKYIKDGSVHVNDVVIYKDDFKLDEKKDLVLFNNVLVSYYEHVYIMFNKPSGTLCANDDKRYPTVFEYVSEYAHRNLFTVGRLDLDTHGFLLISDDGDFAHHIISPKHNIDKVYECHLKEEISSEMIEALESGIEFKDFKADQAKVEVLDKKSILLTIHEGKYHQVKRMLLAVDNEVLYLKRIKIGGVYLDDGLEEGQYRLLSAEELNILKQTQ